MINQKQQRLTQLDGLRGLAIAMVVLNHLRLEPLHSIVSPFWGHVLAMLTASGKIAVGILFMLSGFLMASIYPKIDRPLVFYQKRYTRIFPSFLTMCLAMAILRHFWEHIPTYLVPAIILLVIFLADKFWQAIRNHPRRKKTGQIIFKLFFFLQLAVIAFYLYLQKAVPAAVYYQVWPNNLKSLVDLIINLTLTLPFGKYVAQVDGVYWSVITEVAMYLLYPVIFLPIIELFKNKSVYLTSMTWIFSFPAIYAVNMLAKAILGFDIMQIYIAQFFITGMFLAKIKQTDLHRIFKPIETKVSKAIVFIFALFALFGGPLLNRLAKISNPLDTLLWVPPIAILFIISLNQDQKWSKFLNNRLLVFLGQISYALYLTHTITIELLVKNGPPQNLWQMIYKIIISIALMLGLAYVLHKKMEEPYFKNKLPKLEEEKVINIDQKKTNLEKSKVKFFLIATILPIILIWIAFRTPISPLSLESSHPQEKLDPITIISQEPLKLNIKATHNKLGMFAFALKPLSDKVESGLEEDDFLKVIVRDEQGEIVTQTDFPLYMIYESTFHPIGMPIIQDSLDKKYTLELKVVSDHPTYQLALIANQTNIRSIYFPNKREVLNSPNLLTQLLINKFTQPFQEPPAQQVMIYLLPFWSLLTFTNFSRKPHP